MSAAVEDSPTTGKKKRGKKSEAKSAAMPDGAYQREIHARYFAKLFVNVQPNVVLIDRFERHPDNRVPTPDAIASMMESISTIGHIDAIVARKRPGHDKYQILSGETRWLAIRALGYVNIAARIIECTDAQALALVAEANAKRDDLTLIQSAQLLRRLMLPVDQGGAGMPRDAAAATFGWAPSTVSNVVKLLDAPTQWQRRLESPDLDASGDPVHIHQQTVREIAKFAAAPRLAAAIEQGYQKDLVDEYEDRLFGGREQQLDWLFSHVIDNVRFIDGRKMFMSGHGYQGILFDASDPELQARLEIHELPIADKDGDLYVRTTRPKLKDGQVTAVATNVELFDQLQLEALERLNEGKRPGKSAAKSEAISPAEQRKLDKERRKKADEQLRNWVQEWAKGLLRCSMAESLSGDEALWFAPWLLTSAHCASTLASVSEYVAYAAEDSAIRFGAATRSTDVSATLLHLRGLARDAHAKEQTHSRAEAIDVLRRACQLLLWPAAPESRREKFIATGLPERLPYIDRENLLAWASAVGVTLEQAWQDGAVDGSTERELIAQFLQRHNSEQLASLCEEVCPKVVLPKGKAAAVQAILQEHKPGRPLALPSIAILKEKRKSR